MIIAQESSSFCDLLIARYNLLYISSIAHTTSPGFSQRKNSIVCAISFSCNVSFIFSFLFSVSWEIHPAFCCDSSVVEVTLVIFFFAMVMVLCIKIASSHILNFHEISILTR
jgi:hypothetical protein